MNIRLNRHGITLTEILISSFIALIVIGALIRLATHTLPFYKRTMVRQEIMSEARTSIGIISQFLRQGKAGTLIIQTPNVMPIVPNSQVDFDFQIPMPSGATKGRIGLDNGRLYTQERALNGDPTKHQDARYVASGVTGLMFTGDYRDPALVSVSINIVKALDANTREHPDRVATIMLTNQTVRMVETP